MPMLMNCDAEGKHIKPLAPVMPFNSARQAASVIRSDTGKKTAFLLKPCEKRALFELVKLSQCTLENAVIVTMDCMGRMENTTYLELIKDHSDLTEQFIAGDVFQEHISSSCRTCTEFVTEETDIHINILGCLDQISFSAYTDKGEEILGACKYENAEIPGTRDEKYNEILKIRTENLNNLSTQILSKIKDMDTFQKMIGSCLNCYACRTACPVCYCKECVFLTDIFSHMPETLLNRVEKRGMIKLPTDTTMFHMTRLAHMAHACVGCGQCSSVCPSDIPVADIFRVVSKNVQKFFGYIPGKDTSEPIPFLNYKKKS